MGKAPLTEETRDLIRRDWRRMRHGADTVRTICQLHAATKAQVLEALGELYDPNEIPSRKRGVRTPADPAGAACMDPEKMHGPAPAEGTCAAPETASAEQTSEAVPHVESIVENIRTYIAELGGAFLELSRYGLISEQAADACLQGIRLKAEGFIAGLRWRGILDAGQGQTSEP